MSLFAPIPFDPSRDYLREPPFPAAIPTFEINDAYLKANAEAEVGLRAQGHHVKRGIEANLEIVWPLDAMVLFCIPESPVFFWRAAARDYFADAVDRIKKSYFTLDPYFNMYGVLEKLADQHRQSPTDDSAEWLRNWQMARAFYRIAIREGNKRHYILARKNFVISSLHLLPPSGGGLRGLIQNRHRPTHYGDGWWDGPGSIELRTPPQEGFESAVIGYHQTISQMHNAIEHFGFVSIVHGAVGQSHFSVWRDDDNVNLMAGRDAQALGEQKKLAERLLFSLSAHPLQYPSITENRRWANAHEPIIGSSRACVVRICKEDWELRRRHLSGMTHMLHDTFLVTTAALAYAEARTKSMRTRKAKVNSRNEMEKSRVATLVRDPAEEQLAAALQEELRLAAALQKELREQSLGNFADDRIGRIDPYHAKSQPIRIVKKMNIRSERLRVACPFQATLEAAIINENGEIDVPFHVLPHNGRLMLGIIGKASADLFSVYVGHSVIIGVSSRMPEGVTRGKIFNLETPGGWRGLFKRLKIAEDGFIDASALHPALSVHFADLKVDGYRMELHGGEWSPEQADSREQANARVAAQLAAGKLPFFGRKPTAAQRAIFRFIDRAIYKFDPDEAVKYLVDLFDGLSRDELVMRSNDRITTHLLTDILGNWLKRRQVDLPWQTENGPGSVRDHEILSFFLSMHKVLLAAISEGVHYKAQHLPAILGTLLKELQHPETLYLPDQVWGTVLAACTLSPVVSLAIERAEASESDVRHARHYIMTMSEKLGGFMVRFAAGMQKNARHRAAILEAYAKVAKATGRRDAAGHGITVQLALESRYPAAQNGIAETLVDDGTMGMKKGVEDMAASLLADPRPVIRMRRKALAMLRD